MKILVVSLLRLGDIVLTVPLLRELKKTHPEAEIHLLRNKQFKLLEPLLSFVDKIHYFDRKVIQDSLVMADRPLLEPYDRLLGFVQNLNKEEYNQIINVTHTKLSGWLCGMINANERLGLSYNSSGQASFGSPWFQYMNDYLTTNTGEIFHFADIFKYGAGSLRIF